MADDSWKEWFSELEMDFHINHWHWRGNSLDEEFIRSEMMLEQPQQGLNAPLEDPVLVTMGNSVFAQTNSNNHNNNASLLVASNNVDDPCDCASKVANGSSQLGSDQGTDSRDSGQRRKKIRRSSETLDHIMSERKRRQELTKKFIALSATIPGLKKIDKVHVLSEANKYVKQLQERVKELEESIKKSKSSKEPTTIAISRSHLFIEECTTTTTSSSGSHKHNKNNNEATTLPDVKASVLGNDILIKIHCGKQKGIVLKILCQLQSLHLSIASSNVLPFGNTLDITIIAQMGEKCSTIMKDLVKNLRLALLNSNDVQSDKCYLPSLSNNSSDP